MDVENPTSTLSQSLLSSSLEQSMESKKNSNSQYDAVKMRYFSSLGMNRPPPLMSSSVPTHSYLNGQPNQTTNHGNHPIPAARQRTKTAPSPKSDSFEDSEKEDMRKRTTSVPIPIGFTTSNTQPTISMSTSVGTYITTNTSFDEDDEMSPPQLLPTKAKSEDWVNSREGEEEDIFGEDENLNFGFDSTYEADPNKPQDSPVKFVPPHEMMANSKKDFNVGTAHSVAVWEQRRRKFI